MVNNGAKISLAHWEMDRFLNSHNVASHSNSRNYEVSGFSNLRKKSKKEFFKEVKSDGDFVDLSEIDNVGLRCKTF